jgi:predicted TIM-barrel fold metal-dependent hydrolase
LFFFQAAMGEHGELAQNTRSIAVLHADVSEGTLKDLNAVGVRGVRIQFSAPESGFFKRDEIMPISKRIAPYGWHVQFHLPGPLLADMESLILSLPTPVVIDHKGHAASINDPQFKTARKLLDTGRGWVKVSGINMDSKVKGPTYADSAAVVHEFIRANPDRIVWGSNWPLQGVPDMAVILNVLASAAGSSDLLRRVLVDNPEALYGFDPAHRPPAPK